MNIALLGFGGMGQAVYDCALSQGHTVPIIVDPHAPQATHTGLSVELLTDIDVVLDFTSPGSTLDHLSLCQSAGVNLVVGTTGLENVLETLKLKIDDSPLGFLWSANFSIGVNMYYKVVEYAARLMNSYREYDVWGHEIHHSKKADSPSGTAKILESLLLQSLDRKTEVVEDKMDEPIQPHQLHFSSTRAGAVNFSHTVGFDSAADTITLTHMARNRNGYALGAVKAAEWLVGKQGFFGMSDFLDDATDTTLTS
jgi:4-hydroxy-tetrahydrodipicolinate reductase